MIVEKEIGKSKDISSVYVQLFGNISPDANIASSQVPFEIFTMYKPKRQLYSTGVMSGRVVR